LAREFTDTIEESRLRTSTRKLYFAIEIVLPLSAGDVEPVRIRVAEADLLLPSLLTFEEFTFQSFDGALRRSPDVTEHGDWTTDLETAYATGAAAMLAEASAKVRGLFESAEYASVATTDDRFVTDLYKAYLGRDPEVGGKTFWLGELTSTSRPHLLDAFEDAIEFHSRVATVGAMLRYLPSIRDARAIQISDGAAVDGFDFSLTNLDDRFSTYLGQEDRILYPAPAVVLRAYPVGAGDDYESDVIFPGFVKFKSISKSEAGVTIVADTSRKGLTIATVDTQRCPLIYKGPGCDTNDPSATCSRIWNDAVNGCASKDPAPVLIGAVNNQPSFGGGPDKAVEDTGDSEASGPISPGNVVPPWDYPGYPDPEDPRTMPGRYGPALPRYAL
jgi:hypothetical protein